MGRPDAAGFFGKLPARGDFVQSGLGVDTVTILDAWSAAGLMAAREAYGDAFERVWEQAPHWFFALAPGVLHATAAASGIWVPSADRADRCFPLVLVVLHDPAVEAASAVDAMAPAVLEAVRDGLEPVELERRIEAALATAPAATRPATVPAGWWRHAAHDRSRVAGPSGVLPADDAFVGLLRRGSDEAAVLAP